METTALNETVSQRLKLCQIRHILVDTQLGIAKGYTKAKFFRSRKAPTHQEYEFLAMSERLSGQVNSPEANGFDSQAAAEISPLSKKPQDNSHSQAGFSSMHLNRAAQRETTSFPLPDILKELGVDYVE